MTRHDAAPIRRGAALSACGRYRWALTRTWYDRAATAVFVMLNPSTADAHRDDPTIRRCIGFARREGCGGILVVNRYAWRSTSPADLLAARLRGEDIEGKLCAVWMRIALHAAATSGGPVIAAWGAHPLAAEPLPPLHDPPGGWKCLGATKSGAPRHPLYVRADAPLVPWVSP